jgi:hypothetical protein
MNLSKQFVNFYKKPFCLSLNISIVVNIKFKIVKTATQRLCGSVDV